MSKALLPQPINNIRVSVINMKIAVVGDYDKNRPSHVATSEAIAQSANYVSQAVFVQWLPTQSLEVNSALSLLQEFDGIWGAPGEHKSSLGIINAIQFALEKDIP